MKRYRQRLGFRCPQKRGYGITGAGCGFIEKLRGKVLMACLVEADSGMEGRDVEADKWSGG